MNLLQRSGRRGGLVLFTVLAVVLSACSAAAGPTSSATVNTSAVDTSAVDTSAVDTSAVDTSAVDTSAVDTSAVDTSAVDTTEGEATEGTAGQGGALDFTGTTLDGTTLDAATLAGTPVALWFWAPWCTICRAEAPDVAQIAAEFEGRVRVLGVPGRGEVDAMRGFVSATGTDAITHVADIDGTLWTRFGVVSQPSFVFVDSSGTAQAFAGSLDGEQLRAIFDDLA